MCDQIRITNLILCVDYNNNPDDLLGEGQKTQSIRDLLAVSIDINNLQVAACDAAKEWHRKRENEYACNESGAI
jgi:hypothetical protein